MRGPRQFARLTPGTLIRIKELEEPHGVILGNRDTWYTGPQAKDKCWPAIVDLLRKDGWSGNPDIKSLDDSSTRVVSLLNHSKEKSFSTRDSRSATCSQ
ncbi:hypothetical protein [Streptomyces sp. NPDC059828]|uniref:hypothetical protein n=1 Tax=Streptomyces sp. NPDC059828 TaxID=3346965 RepID=UPI0036556135